MTREEAIDAMLAAAPCDWWRFVPCRTCNAARTEPCQGPDRLAPRPHIARRRAGLALHGTLWLLDNGYAGDVLGEEETG